jgi:acyl-coenzyme A synthetase/AMP-(fatty) acid ligase
LTGKKFYICNHLGIQEATHFAKTLEKYSITFFSSVPSSWEIILNFSPKPNSEALKLLRIHCASAPINSDKKLRIKQWIGAIPFYDVYGATEMLGWFSAKLVSDNSQDWIESYFSEFWDAETKTSETNTLLIKSRYMFNGYLNIEKTEEFFNTGDIFLNNSILGREKSTINKNGIKIYTQELNSIYLKSQLIQDVATFPIPHLFSGEEIGVYIVAKSGVLHDQILDYFNSHVSSHKQPFAAYFVDALPINSRGKVAFTNLDSTIQSIESTEKTVLEIFNKTLNSNFKELNTSRENFPKWDSMKHAELILNLQKTFNVKFKISEIQNADNLKKIFNYLLNHLPK